MARRAKKKILPPVTVTLCGARNLKPKTAAALGKVFAAAYKQLSRRCIDRGSHIACRK